MEAAREDMVERVEWAHHDFERIPTSLQSYGPNLKYLCLSHNHLTALPVWFSQFVNLEYLDLSNNRFQFLPHELLQLPSLKTLLIRNNQLDNSSLPKVSWENLDSSLETLNLSGNRLEVFPENVCSLVNLTNLYLGANRIRRISPQISRLRKLEILYLGGNRLTEVHPELGNLSELVYLVLSDNRIETLPNSLGNLSSLRSLSLHGNHLQILPQEILQLRNLEELSLRNNPLVVRFIRDMNWCVPSLLELCGRVIRLESLNYNGGVLPKMLVEYLNSGHQCVNPKCKGVYFTSRVDHVKFVDFCGKYRVPLQQYLCSPNCSTPQDNRFSSTSSDSEAEGENRIMQRVLLG